MPRRFTNYGLACLVGVLVAAFFADAGCRSASAAQQTVYYGGYETGTSTPIAGSFSYDPTQPASAPPGDVAFYDATGITFDSSQTGLLNNGAQPVTMTIDPTANQLLVGSYQIGIDLALSNSINTPAGIASSILQVGGGNYIPTLGSDDVISFNITAASASFANTFVFDPSDQVGIAVPNQGGGTAYTFGGLSIVVSGPNITASFTPQSGLSLANAATLGGFSRFNWQQTVTSLPYPSPFFAATDPCVINNPNSYGLKCTSLSTPSTQYPNGIPDPPPGGYTDSLNTYPYYLPNSDLAPGACLESDIPAFCPVETTTTLNFFDDPSDPCLPGGSIKWRFIHVTEGVLPPSCILGDAFGSTGGFETQLVGIPLSGGAPVSLFSFAWTDDFNGTAGGAAVLDGFSPVDPDSGTGGPTLISVDGTSIPEPGSLLLLMTFAAIFATLIIQKYQRSQSE